MPKLFTDLKNDEPVNDFIENTILKKKSWDTVYIVKLRAWYKHERMMDVDSFNELLTTDDYETFIWDSDWYEGQENVLVCAIYGMNELDLQDNV